MGYLKTLGMNGSKKHGAFQNLVSPADSVGTNFTQQGRQICCNLEGWPYLPIGSMRRTVLPTKNGP